MSGAVATTKAAAASATAAGAAVVVLGIPAATLVAAFLGAAISHLPRKGQPDEVILKRVIGVVSDAFIGGWIAVSLLHFTPLQPYGIHNIPAAALGGLMALVVQMLRAKGNDFLERAFAAGLERIRGRRPGGSNGA